MPLGYTSLLLFSAKARGTVLPQGLSICCSLSLNHFCSKWPQASLPLLLQILLKSHYTGELSLATLYKIAQQLPSPLPFPVSLTSLSFLYSIYPPSSTLHISPVLFIISLPHQNVSSKRVGSFICPAVFPMPHSKHSNVD